MMYCNSCCLSYPVPRPLRGNESSATAPGQRPFCAKGTSVGLRRRRNQRSRSKTLSAIRISPFSTIRSPSKTLYRRDLRTCRACWRRCQKRIKSPLAPPRRAIRRPLIGWPTPTWRVCQWNGATAAGASGGRWHRSDRGGPVSGVDLDAGPASDRDKVLTRERCATVAPAR